MKTAVLLFALALDRANLNAATIILVRHAERAAGTDSSVPLSEPGQKRAQLLARMLAGSGVRAIFTSDALRTQQTAAPLAKQLRIDASAVPATETNELVTKLQKLGADEVVLVVGHSNTVPDIVTKLGGLTPPIPDNDFGRMVGARPANRSKNNGFATL